ncbi:hypothetical protein ABG768_023359, partial [Culter alburnus]
VLLCGRDKGASLRSVCWQLRAERVMTGCCLIQSEPSPATRALSAQHNTPQAHSLNTVRED